MKVLYAVSAVAALAVPAQHQAAEVNLQNYTRPSTLVRVEPGRNINLLCFGSGEPTVLLVSGIADSLVSWRHVQAEIAKRTKTCSYDRAGLGFSDPSSRESDLKNADADLYKLVRSGVMATPVILVGHSLGGLIATTFTAEHRGLVSGLVLIDPVIAGENARLDDLLSPSLRKEGAENRRQALTAKWHCILLAREGSLESPTVSNAQACLDFPVHDEPVLHTE